MAAHFKETAMAADKIRIGIIGAGANTRLMHIPGLRKQPGVEIVSVANRSPESSRKAAEELGIAKAARDWTELLADPGIDAVCIGTWPYMHAAITIAALEAGKHVLCEARMAMNAPQAHAMLAASRRHPSQVAQIVPSPFTLEFDRTIIAMIAAGRIGDVISLDMRVSTGNFPEGGAMHWRHDRDLSGNNVMLMGIQYESILRWVGPATSAYAVAQTVVRHRLDASGARVPMAIPDHVDVVGELQQGGQYRLAMSSVIGLAPARTEVYIFGSEGTLALITDKPGGSRLLYGARGDKALAPVTVDPALKGAWRVEEEFVNAIRGKEPVTHTDFLLASKYMEWTDAVEESIRTRQRVGLPLPLLRA
jgi:predicted dehydrogenase